MKKKIIALILAGTMALFICSCGNKEPDTLLHITSPQMENIQEGDTF